MLDATETATRRQGTRITVASSGQALTLDQAKRQLRIEPDDTDGDSFVQDLIVAAHGHVERLLGYPILRQTRQTHAWGFPCCGLWLGAGDSLTVAPTAVKYIDTNGAVQTLASTEWVLDALSSPAVLYCAPGKSWPATQARPGAVTVDWVAGWADAASVPADILHAMRLLIGHWDQNREAVVVGTVSNAVQLTVDALLEPHRPPAIA